MKFAVMTVLGLLLAFGALPSQVAADTPIHLATTRPQTPLTDVLAAFSKQAGVPILVDDTVSNTIGTTTIDKPSLEAMLATLDSLVPGLAWQKLYLPQGAPLPSGDILSQQVRTLKAISTSGLVISDAQTQKTLTFSNKPSAAPAVAPDGMQVVYLVTNETIRAQREAQKKAAAGKPDTNLPTANPNAPVAQAVGGISATADVFSQMTPDQQRQALPLMFQQFQRIMQSMDPTVRDQIRQQFRPRPPQNGQ